MRVELEEIEAALGALPGIAQGAVALHGGSDGHLVAYVVPSTLPEEVAAGETIALEGVLDLEAGRSGLKRVLPEHMVPSSYVRLTRLPLTSSAQLGRRALPLAGVVGATAT